MSDGRRGNRVLCEGKTNSPGVMGALTTGI